MNSNQMNWIRRIRYSRVSLKSYFVLLALSALACVFYSYWLIRRPIEWRAYQATTLSPTGNSQSPLIVLIGADWDMNSKLMKEVSLEQPALKQILQRHSVGAYYADYTRPSPHVNSLLTSIGRNSTPHLVVFPNGPAGKSVVFSRDAQASDIIAAIRNPLPTSDPATSSLEATGSTKRSE